MTQAGPRTLSELVDAVGDGETKVFRRTADPTGQEPSFFRVGTSGEIQVRPLWVNSPSLENAPRAPIRTLNEIPLSVVSKYHFSIAAKLNEVADLYRIGIGVFLVSGSLADLVVRRDPNSVERVAAVVEIEGELDREFFVIMPRRVSDLVDTRKTDITVSHKETSPGSRRFKTAVEYSSGFVVRDDVDPTVQNFLGKYDGNWWWRSYLVEAARSLPALGLRAVSSRNAMVGGNQ